MERDKSHSNNHTGVIEGPKRNRVHSSVRYKRKSHCPREDLFMKMIDDAWVKFWRMNTAWLKKVRRERPWWESMMNLGSRSKTFEATHPSEEEGKECCKPVLEMQAGLAGLIKRLFFKPRAVEQLEGLCREMTWSNVHLRKFLPNNAKDRLAPCLPWLKC